MNAAPLILAAWAMFGAVFGSFGNVVIWRFPRGESLNAPASSCPTCGHPIRWYDNVPVASWLALGARCRDCGARISWRYPLVEAMSACLFVSAAWVFRHDLWSAAVTAAFLWTLLVLSFIDLDTMRLPNPIVGALAGSAAVAAVVSQFTGVRVVPLNPAATGWLAQPLVAAGAGGLLGAGLSYLIAAVYAAVRKREGFGMGDVKLLGAMGIILGPYVLVAFFAGSVLGVMGRVAAALAGREGLGERAPFGPYLAAGGALAALVGPQMVAWYLRAVGLV